MSDRAERTAGDAKPSPWIVRFLPLVAAGGRVLDMACGHGRHSVLFASRGCRVIAVDRDAHALASLQNIAGVTPMRADLEADPWPFSQGRFDAIVVTHYLHRALFPALLGALADDGVLLYETFAAGNEKFGRPSNADFLLAPSELLFLIDTSLTVVAFEQGAVGGARPAVMQRVAAVGRARDWPPPLPS